MAKLALRVVLFGWAATSLLASSQIVHPVSGNQERLLVHVGSSGKEILWQENDAGWQTPVALTANSTDDLDPEFCVSGITGRRMSVYWRDTPTPSIVVQRDDAAANWWPGEMASDASVDSRFPVCAFFGGQFHVAYEARTTGGLREVVVGSSNDDDPPPCSGEGCPQEPPTGGPDDPIGISQLRATSVTFTAALRLHVEDGHLWADWIDSNTTMGYAEYDAVLGWSAVSTVTYSGDVEASRASVRVQVLGY